MQCYRTEIYITYSQIRSCISTKIKQDDYFGGEFYDYYKITEEGAKILMNESNELVYYNSEIDVYVWGICHYGMSWKLIPTSIPI